MNMKPDEIEKMSFTLIDGELRLRAEQHGGRADGRTERTPLEEAVLRRVIHTSADFGYDENLVFTHNAAAALFDALRRGCTVVTDTRMALAGINKRALETHRSRALCFIDDEEVAREAAEKGTTRSACAVDKAAALSGPLVFAVGNAPTALLRIRELVQEGTLAPLAVIGVPVGFVNVVEAKESLFELDVPCVIARGRKGGSSIAAAIVNALLYYGGEP
jgi:precorrin-8X/cobalt-precorrin-8 methylmutase